MKCEILHEIVEGSSGKNVVIDCIEHPVFEVVLKYIYTVEEPILGSGPLGRGQIDFAKAVLAAADRFGVTGLKLFDLMLFADAHSCALLKEAAFDIYAKEPKLVRASQDWGQLKKAPDLFDELFEYTTIKRHNLPLNDDGEENIDGLKVPSLRRRCEGYGLDIDGTRETLVDRVKKHQKELERDWEEDYE
ncbi:MAG: hypothetical protein SGARI_000937 [Bacillariaceae sp.]